MFNDALAHRIMEKSDLDLQAYQPIILFINGEYWGLHEMREANKSNWYFEVHHGVDTDNPGIDLIYHHDKGHEHHPEANEGDIESWNNLTEYIHCHDLSKKECYNYVKTQVDIENLINYIAHSIYMGKWDWPGMNEATWRPRTNKGRWRYIPYDMETGFGAVAGLDSALGPSLNMFDHVMEGTDIAMFGRFGPHLVFKECMKNKEFADAFIMNMENKLENEFSAKTTISLLKEMVEQLEPYMEEHWKRWSQNPELSKANWFNSIEGIKDFMERRPIYLKEQLEEFKVVYVN
jgi:hypothetical protein